VIIDVVNSVDRIVNTSITALNVTTGTIDIVKNNPIVITGSQSDRL